MDIMDITYLETSETGVEWYELSGTPDGFPECEFDGDIYGVTADGKVVNRDNCPMTPGDYETMAVQKCLDL